MTFTLNTKICESARLSRDARFDGKFFTAVLSTGIFCRPICPARPPKPENVQYYLSAEQALQAGFSPCKRCFPEQAAMKNLPPKIKKIIHSVDYQQNNISDIAQKFHLSPRQLQRIFKQYFGISPSAYFQQQRLLLARKLLSTTQLSISDICFASGFQSVRRFNEAIKACYQCPPSSIRKQSKLSNNNLVEISLAYRPPFDWPLMLSFFRNRQIAGVEYIDEHSYQRSIRLDDCVGWFSLSHAIKQSALILRVSLSDFSYLNQVIIRVRRMFDLDADMQLIHEQLNDHPLLAQVIKRCPGLRLPGCWDIFEFSVRAILGQQVSVKAATTFAKRISEKYGQYHPDLAENTQLTFPSAKMLADTDFDGLGLTQSRRDTLQRWIAFYLSNSDLMENYPSLEQLEQQLCQIKGIGPWTVNYIAMRGLSEPDAFPSADLGIIKALTDNQTKPKNQQILALAEQWRPWRSYAAIYLWQSLTPNTPPTKD
ncbi:DNA-3-methyladenine glycosylase 2 [Thalassotalea sp. G2M2-11]|uniref:DNA-3-methyladenine glycosylase 2 family protein n=1 Tax=Thalassotalea sp. G2M2-11 TaxID=2787627 RepID=UPI0019D1CB51|nr:DNA-3-methyladenine glycosylase 2 [Thalassotalea sp. G2M2-11]